MDILISMLHSLYKFLLTSKSQTKMSPSISVSSNRLNLFLNLKFFLSPFTSVVETENSRLPVISIFYYILQLKIKKCL